MCYNYSMFFVTLWVSLKLESNDLKQITGENHLTTKKDSNEDRQTKATKQIQKK